MSKENTTAGAVGTKDKEAVKDKEVTFKSSAYEQCKMKVGEHDVVIQNGIVSTSDPKLIKALEDAYGFEKVSV